MGFAKPSLLIDKGRKPKGISPAFDSYPRDRGEVQLNVDANDL